MLRRVQLGGEALRSLSLMDDLVTAARGITGKLEGGNGDFRGCDGSSLVISPATCDGDKTSGILLTGFLMLSTGAQTKAPDLFLRNGHIFTGDSANAWAEALSIQGDHVLGLGADPAISTTADKHTRVIDLGGHMAMRGVNDAHDHVGGAHYGTEARTKQPPHDDPPLTELTEAVRAAATAPAGGWIYASVGVFVIRHPQQARAVIDEAGAGHPVILNAWWGHGVILNTSGLARLNLDDSVKDPPGGHYDRDTRGHLTGLAEESAGTAIKLRLVGTETGVLVSLISM